MTVHSVLNRVHCAQFIFQMACHPLHCDHLCHAPRQRNTTAQTTPSPLSPVHPESRTFPVLQLLVEEKGVHLVQMAARVFALVTPKSARLSCFHRGVETSVHGASKNPTRYDTAFPRSQLITQVCKTSERIHIRSKGITLLRKKACTSTSIMTSNP